MVKPDEVDRKRKLEDDEIEQLLLGQDDDEPNEDLPQLSGNLKRKKISPPNSPILRKRKCSKAAKEKWMLQSKDEKADQVWRSKEPEQLHQSLDPNAGGVKLSAGADISSEQVRNSKDQN